MIDILTAPVTEEQEWVWEDIVRQDVQRDQARKRKSQLPPVPNEGNDYRLDDIRSYVKLHSRLVNALTSSLPGYPSEKSRPARFSTV